MSGSVKSGSTWTHQDVLQRLGWPRQYLSHQGTLIWRGDVDGATTEASLTVQDHSVLATVALHWVSDDARYVLYRARFEDGAVRNAQHGPRDMDLPESVSCFRDLVTIIGVAPVVMDLEVLPDMATFEEELSYAAL